MLHRTWDFAQSTATIRLAIKCPVPATGLFYIVVTKAHRKTSLGEVIPRHQICRHKNGEGQTASNWSQTRLPQIKWYTKYHIPENYFLMLEGEIIKLHIYIYKYTHIYKYKYTHIHCDACPRWKHKKCLICWWHAKVLSITFPGHLHRSFPGPTKKIISLKAHTNSVVEGISAIEIRATCSILLPEFPPLSRELPNMYTRQASVQPNFTNLNMEWTHRWSQQPLIEGRTDI